MNTRTLSFGCRLNAVECEKISHMLSDIIDNAIIVNTCSVTGEAERQCAQTVRKLSRENPNAIIFVKGHGILPNLEFALLILNFPSNPVVYRGNINTVTYINASLIP